MQTSPLAAAEAFAAVARGFCSWMESPSLGAEQEVAAAAWLAKLHASALVLPEVDSDNEDGLPEIPPQAIEAAKRNLAAFRGMYYRECFNPDPALSEEPVLGDVGDDLLGTYQDIRRGLLVFDRSEPLEALWHWSFLHRIHWGHHAVGAMFALQCLPRAEQENAP